MTHGRILCRPGGHGIYYPPVGEQFVQKIFNEQEDQYPIIDNLSRKVQAFDTAMADRGVWGTGEDIARFASFNLFQTSLRQKVQILGEENSPEEKPRWNIPKAVNRVIAFLSLPYHKTILSAQDFSETLSRQKKPNWNSMRSPGTTSVSPMKMSKCSVSRPRSGQCHLQDADARTGSYDGETPCTESMGPRKPSGSKKGGFPGDALLYLRPHPSPRGGLAAGRQITREGAEFGAFHRVIDEKGFLLRVKAKGINRRKV